MMELDRISPYLTAVNDWLREHTSRGNHCPAGFHKPSHDERKILRQLTKMLYASSEICEQLGKDLVPYIDGEEFESSKYAQKQKAKYLPLYVRDHWEEHFYAFMALHPPPDITSVTGDTKELLRHQYEVLDAVKPKSLFQHSYMVVAPAIHLDKTSDEVAEPFGLTQLAKGNPTLFVFPGHADFYCIANREHDIRREALYRKVRAYYHHLLQDVLSDQPPVTAALVLQYPTLYKNTAASALAQTYYSKNACAFIDRFILPILSRRDSDGTPHKLDDIAPALKQLSKITLFGYCYGGAMVEYIEHALQDYTRALGYSESEISAVFNSLGALTIACSPAIRKLHMIPRICSTLNADDGTYILENYTPLDHSNTVYSHGLKYACDGSQLHIAGTERPQVPLAYNERARRFFPLYQESAQPEIREADGLLLDRDTATQVSPHLAQHFLHLHQTVRRNSGVFKVNQTSLIATPMRAALEGMIEAGRDGVRDGEAVVTSLVSKHLSPESLKAAHAAMRDHNAEFNRYLTASNYRAP